MSPLAQEEMHSPSQRLCGLSACTGLLKSHMTQPIESKTLPDKLTTSHINISVSAPPEARRAPEELYARACTAARWPLRVAWYRCGHYVRVKGINGSTHQNRFGHVIYDDNFTSAISSRNGTPVCTSCYLAQGALHVVRIIRTFLSDGGNLITILALQ